MENRRILLERTVSHFSHLQTYFQKVSMSVVVVNALASIFVFLFFFL